MFSWYTQVNAMIALHSQVGIDEAMLDDQEFITLFLMFMFGHLRASFTLLTMVWTLATVPCPK